MPPFSNTTFAEVEELKKEFLKLCKIIYKNGFTISHSPFSTKESESKELQRFKGGWCIFQSLQLPLSRLQQRNQQFSSLFQVLRSGGKRAFLFHPFPFLLQPFSLSIRKSRPLLKLLKEYHMRCCQRNLFAT